MKATEKRLQAFHLSDPGGSPAALLGIKRIRARFDHKTQEHIILWNDITSVYKEANHIEIGGEVLSFLTDENFEYLRPLRIRAELDDVLDVVILSQAGTSGEPGITITQRRVEEPVVPKLSEVDTLNSNTEADSNSTKSLETDMKDLPVKEDGTDCPVVVESQGECIPRDESKSSEKSTTPESEGLAAALAKAVKEDAVIQVMLGYMYFSGNGVLQDYTEAFDWYFKAASQGHAAAQYNLGKMYYDGNGTPQDYAKAFEWYHKAASQGYASAQCNLGEMYYDGNGTLQDYAKAFEWYLKAANQGEAVAQYNLGQMYHEGNGVPQDYSKAIDWYLKAANQGNADAQYTLGVIYHNGDGVTLDYSKAIDWYLKAANQGDTDSQRIIASMYHDGKGVSRNLAKAKRWYQKAADQGDTDAQYTLDQLER